MPKLEDLHLMFWGQLLRRSTDKGFTLFENCSPSKKLFIHAGTGMSGVSFSYVIRLDDAKVAFVIQTSDEERNKEIFDHLNSKRKQIDSKFGDDLRWDRMENLKRCLIDYIINEGGLNDQSKWTEIQDAMIDAMDRLSKALKPYIQKFTM